MYISIKYTSTRVRKNPSGTVLSFSFYTFLHNHISNHLNLTTFPMIYCPNGNIYRLVTERRTDGIKHHNFSDRQMTDVPCMMSVDDNWITFATQLCTDQTDRRISINFLFYCTQRQTWKI